MPVHDGGVVGMQSQQLPTESQVLEDEVLTGNRKVLTDQPRKCRSDTIMARIVAEKSESSFRKSFILRVYHVLARHSGDFALVFKCGVPWQVKSLPHRKET